MKETNTHIGIYNPAILINDFGVTNKLIIRAVNFCKIFIDSDNNPATGWESIDYLIEDNKLYEFTGTNNHQWAWKVRWLSTKLRNISAVESARGFSSQRPTKGSVELKLHKSVLSKLKSKKINIRFSALNSNWSEPFAMPTNSEKLSEAYNQRNTVKVRS